MVKIIHRASERGKGEHGWLHSNFSFSFAHWYEPTKMGFGALRVLNDDIIEPNNGFGMHEHDNMEIVTIVTNGTVTHSDTMGNKKEVPAGDVQIMSAGSGVAHSEFNESADERLELFQLWIVPKEKNITPRYGQMSFTDRSMNVWQTVVGPDGGSDMLAINQDAYISRIVLEPHFQCEYEVKIAGNGVFFFVVSGSIDLDGDVLEKRDAIGVSMAQNIGFKSLSEDTVVLTIEVPMD